MVTEFDVFTADHDDIKTSVFTERHSRIVMDETAFKSMADCSATACCMAIAIHGGMVTRILIRI